MFQLRQFIFLKLELLAQLGDVVLLRFVLLVKQFVLRLQFKQEEGGLRIGLLPLTKPERLLLVRLSKRTGLLVLHLRLPGLNSHAAEFLLLQERNLPVLVFDHCFQCSDLIGEQFCVYRGKLLDLRDAVAILLRLLSDFLNS